MWFSILELKNAFSPLQLCNDTSKQCNFSIVGSKITETYQFLTGYHGLGDMTNEFQNVREWLLKKIPFTNCCIDDILKSSKASLEENKMILWNYFIILENKNIAVKWEKCAFFQKDIE